MQKLIKITVVLVVVFVVLDLLGRYTERIVPLSARESYLNTTEYISADVKPHLEQLIADAQTDGMCLVVMSGYRTQADQEMLYEKEPTIAAQPGKSEHQKGIAVDFGGCPMTNGIRDDSAVRLELRKPFDQLPEYKWLTLNASKYGFVQSYTNENSSTTGFPAEAWHWRYER